MRRKSEREEGKLPPLEMHKANQWKLAERDIVHSAYTCNIRPQLDVERIRNDKDEHIIRLCRLSYTRPFFFLKPSPYFSLAARRGYNTPHRVPKPHHSSKQYIVSIYMYINIYTQSDDRILYYTWRRPNGRRRTVGDKRNGHLYLQFKFLLLPNRRGKLSATLPFFLLHFTILAHTKKKQTNDVLLMNNNNNSKRSTG